MTGTTVSVAEFIEMNKKVLALEKKDKVLQRALAIFLAAHNNGGKMSEKAQNALLNDVCVTATTFIIEFIRVWG